MSSRRAWPMVAALALYVPAMILAIVVVAVVGAFAIAPRGGPVSYELMFHFLTPPALLVEVTLATALYVFVARALMRR